jgi:hypothetical protein
MKITKENGIHEMKPEKNHKTKRDFTSDETKRNETKFRYFVCFAKHAKFRETIVLFRFVSCFAKQKKGCEMETLNTCKQNLFSYPDSQKESALTYSIFVQNPDSRPETTTLHQSHLQTAELSSVEKKYQNSFSILVERF